MKIAGRGGHSLDVRGASGIIDEVTEDRLITKRVFEFLALHGVEILDVTPTYSGTSAVDLTVACKKANDWGADFYFSIHLNASGGRGVEVIYGSAAGKVYADRICAKLAALGFPNRGTYADRRGLYEFRGCKMPNVIIEVCFVDNADDVALYHKLGYNVIAKAIVEGICGQNIVTPVANVPLATAPAPQAPDVDAMVLRLQRNLNRLWFTDDNGQTLTEDGLMGAKTKQAVKKFQKVASLQVDGIAGMGTWNALNTILAKPLCKQDKFNRVAVRYIQWRLDINADGIFGTNTTGRVKSYQIDKGLAPDGIFGAASWHELIG